VTARQATYSPQSLRNLIPTTVACGPVPCAAVHDFVARARGEDGRLTAAGRDKDVCLVRVVGQPLQLYSLHIIGQSDSSSRRLMEVCASNLGFDSQTERNSVNHKFFSIQQFLGRPKILGLRL
jgi:hypothetical protein